MNHIDDRWALDLDLELSPRVPSGTLGDELSQAALSQTWHFLSSDALIMGQISVCVFSAIHVYVYALYLLIVITSTA